MLVSLIDKDQNEFLINRSISTIKNLRLSKLFKKSLAKDLTIKK